MVQEAKRAWKPEGVATTPAGPRAPLCRSSSRVGRAGVVLEAKIFRWAPRHIELIHGLPFTVPTWYPPSTGRAAKLRSSCPSVMDA